MSKYLILWNNTQYAKVLADSLDSTSVIVNNDELKTVIEDLEDYSSMIVLCELEWTFNESAASRQQLEGIELIKDLRRIHSLTLPVLFVSFLSLKNIFNAGREIITAIGHDFLQLPTAPHDLIDCIKKEFEFNGSLIKLSEIELNDIKSFYCSKEGILTHELHHLNEFLNYNITKENHHQIYCELENSIRKIHELFLVDSTKSLVSFQMGFYELTKENITDAINSIIRQGNDLLKDFGTDSNKDKFNENDSVQFYWKVLLLDDQIDEKDELVQLMKKNNISLICVDNALDAKRILYTDWCTENKIMVVIADYRLYQKTSEVKRHQKIQGYQFLKDIASSDQLIRLVAFSGLQRKFLLNSFKHYNIRTEVKSKTDYLSTEKTRQQFCDEIIEMAEDNMEVIEALPSKCAGFKKHLEIAYKRYRMHPDYYKMENNVSLTAKEYVLEIQQQIKNGDDIIIGSIENIKSPLAKTMKDSDAFFNRFSNYLVARRIALWLYASNKKRSIYNIDSRKIAEILTNQCYSTDAYRQIISTNLGLSLDDFPKNITIEERRWLQYEMQLNIFRDINMMDPVFSQSAKYLKDLILKCEDLSDDIFVHKYTITHKYKQVNYSIHFEKDYTPIIKTSTDLRVLFIYFLVFVQKHKKKQELIKPLVSRLRFLLFENRNNVIYLNNLFQYFNNLYRILNKEQTSLSKSTSRIFDKSTFIEKANSSIEQVFERVYELLLNNLLPSETDIADVFSVFVYGEEVLKSLDRKKIEDKGTFFHELTKKMNNVSNLTGFTLNENYNYQKNNNIEYDEEIYDEVFKVYNNDDY